MDSQALLRGMILQHIDSLESICEDLGLTKAEARFMDEQNPLHYRARLLDLGFTQKEAKEISHWYNEIVFTPIMEIYKNRKQQGGNDGIYK